MKKIATVLLSFFICNFSFAQTSNIDTTFNTADGGFGYGVGANPNAVAVQTDGKIIIAGSFTTYNTTPTNRIARLNADGTLDTTFNIGTGPDNYIVAVAIQSDGKIIIAGAFKNYNGIVANCVARINTNGSLDATYNVGTGPTGGVGLSDMAMQTDGKVIIVGTFTTFNGTSIRSIARINTNGTLDGTFNPGTGVSSGPSCITIQSNGKIMIGGGFTSYNGVSIFHIARVNSNGTLDTTFDPGAGPNSATNASSVSNIKVQTDGKIIIVGNFVFYGTTQRKFIARVSSSGALDLSYSHTSGAVGQIYSAGLQSDGKCIISGVFTAYNGTSRPGLARINTDGTVDASFNPLSGISLSQYITILSNGKVLVGGKCLYSDGTIDFTFNNVGTGSQGTIKTTAIQTDGKIIIAGAFGAFDGTLINRITRLNTDGTRDLSFNPGTGANSTIETIKIQSDGKILIGGSFTTFDGVSTGGAVRLTTNGALDVGFTIGTGADNTVYEIDQQSDGKIIIVGDFTSFNGTAINRIARLSSTGILDPAFNIGTGANVIVKAVKVLSDDKILIGGKFTTYNGTAINRFARLNIDGTLDGTFTVGTGVNNDIEIITIQNDGKILIGGAFSLYNGVTKNSIARINSDGTLDPSYNGSSGIVYAIAPQFDNKILIACNSSKYIMRTNPDGSLDASFNVGTGASSFIYSIALQSDAKIIIGGDFISYGGTGKNRVARLLNGNLSTGAITGSPFCAGASITVPYSATGSFNPGNIFTAQLSNSSGSFASPITIGTLSSTTSGTINAVIPTNSTTGTGYRIRVIGSDIATTGSDNGADFNINVLPSGSVTGQTNVTCFGGSNGSGTVAPAGGSSPYIFFWAPFGGFSSTASNLPAGNYTVTITDSRNCAIGVPVTIAQPAKLILGLSSQTNVSCYNGSNGTATVTATGGSGGNAYLWSPTGFTSSSVSGLSVGSYIVEVTDLNACPANLVVNITQPAILTGALVNTTNTSCSLSSDGSASVTGNGGTPFYSYNWLPSGGTNSTANNLSVGTYTVNISDAKACATSVPVSILNIVPSKEICVVTADSATGNYNIVIWEKPGNISNIDSFYVYREITLNNFQKIGAVHRDSLSIYNDYAANPNSTSYKYKIKVLDTCGSIGNFGLYHSSIHLQYLGSGNFLWTVYQIENTPNQVSDYNFYRDNNGTGNFTFLQLIPGGNNSYTDINYASYPSARYRVDVNWISGHICNPTRGSIITTRSNIKSAGVTTSLSDNIIKQMLISPNPASKNFTINFSELNVNYEIILYNTIGQIVYDQKEHSSSANPIDVTDLSKGIYTVCIIINNSKVFKKLVIQ